MSEEKIQEEIKKANFKLLKVQLYNYIKSNFRVCDSFLMQLESCENELALTNLFRKYHDDVYSKLGGDPDLENEVHRLESKVERLENDLTSAEHELKDATVLYGNTLDDEYKRQFIQQYYSNYTRWELETLLKNGKELLRK